MQGEAEGGYGDPGRVCILDKPNIFKLRSPLVKESSRRKMIEPRKGASPEP
jgi:hypothetical protein